VHKYRDLYSKKGKVIHRTDLIDDTDYTILSRYQGVLRGLYNYYCMAVNVSQRMNRIGWMLQRSLTKTLARKYRCKGSEILKRHRAILPDFGDGPQKVLRVVVERPGKDPLVAVYGGIPFKRIPDGKGAVNFDFEQAWFAPGCRRTEVVQRLLV